ncbi:DMT family transporter [Cupriavidus sp. DF5525]|uniref:DMT family transporter n=1 Tax=Cupriavidus sp. DF5525 TaxID=3160989 RepID=UPI0006855AED
MAVGLMVVLCAAWGLQQVVIKVTAPLMGAVLQAGVRSAVAALLVFGFAAWRGTPIWRRDGTFNAGLLAGLLFGAEFFCIFVGLGHTTASRMAVFLYTAPIFTALGLHFVVPGERLHTGQWLGVALAFVGMALAFADGIATPSAHGGTLLGDALGILAGALWAATTVVVRASPLASAPASKTLLYQLAVSAVMLLAMAVAAGQTATVQIDGVVLASLFYQSVLIAFASYLTWFWLLRRYLASRLSVFSFLTPLFGVAFGVVLMHDAVGPRFAVAALLVLAGIVLVNRRA